MINPPGDRTAAEKNRVAGESRLRDSFSDSIEARKAFPPYLLTHWGGIDVG